MKSAWLAVAALVALGLPGCSDPRPGRVVLGIGLTPNSHAGVKLAADEINAAGGIDGVRLELAGLDSTSPDAYSPWAILATAAKFNAIPELLAVIGHSDSASTLAAAASYNRDGIPQIVTIATNPAITNIGSWTYRLCLSDSTQGPALATYAVQQWRKTRLGIIYVNDDYGRGLARLFEARARALGAHIVATAMHRNKLQAEDQQTIAETLADLKREEADMVALFQRVEAAKWTLHALRGAGLDAAVLGSDNLAQHAFARDPSGLADGVRVSQFVNLDTSRPRVARFVDRIKAATGRDPDYAQAYGYDAVFMVRDAILRGGFTREGVKSSLDRLITGTERVQGVTGSFTLAADHDARRPLYIAEVRAGAFRLLGALPVE